VTTRGTRAAVMGLALAIGLAPRVALACAACLSSAYGDRSFNWAYGALMLAPFLVAVVIGAVLAWNAGYRLRWRPSMRASTVTGPIPANEERS
jgi:protein-L-isoaspartate O-methyltransferase